MIDALTGNLSIDMSDLTRSIHDIQSHVKALKNKATDGHQSCKKNMAEYIQTVIEYMGSRGSYRSKIFLRSVILLDNMLALYTDLLFSAQFSKELVENVSIFFYHHRHNSDTNEQSHLYAVLYLVLLMISKSNHCLILRKILLSHLFKPRFLKKLISIQYQKSPQIAKILPIIISFILRGKKNYTKDMNLKQIVFSLIQKKIEQTSIHLILCLKQMLPLITFADINKYSLCDFLVENMSQDSAQNVIRNSLSITNIFLIKFPSLVSVFIKADLMSSWGKQIKSYPRVCLSIFQTVISQITSEKLEEWFYKYYNHLKKDKKNEIHLRILACLTKRVSNSIILEAINDGLMSQIQNLEKSQKQSIKLASKNLHWALESTVKNFNTNLWIVCAQQDQTSSIKFLS